MFGSVVLDVAIGLAFIYLLLSLICSAIREGIEIRLKSRAIHLERGIREILTDQSGTQLAKKLYEHPLIYSLYEGKYTPPGEPTPAADDSKKLRELDFTRLRWLWATVRSWFPGGGSTNLPSYIPARNFALALFDLTARGELQSGNVTSTSISIDQVRATLATLDNPGVERALLTALDTARDLETGIHNLEAWYNSAMDRVSGWYKRETQHILFWLGLIVTVVLNVDTIAIMNHLAMSEYARNALVQRATDSLRDTNITARVEADRARATAESPSADGSPAMPSTPADSRAPTETKNGPSQQSGGHTAMQAAEAELKALEAPLLGLNMPIGWSAVRAGTPSTACTATSERLFSWMPTATEIRCFVWPHDLRTIVAFIPGWLITAFAISFGAPFWFDLLNKMILIRSTVKPAKEIVKDGADDNQSAGAAP